MPVTTVLNEGPLGATIVSDSEPPRRFSWSAAFAGAFVATAVTLFLLTLGSGVGLSLVTVRHATGGDTVTFLTLGAIYFLAAQAFGFAAGGHIVGRLIGPAIETGREEEIRAGLHGLVAWALAVVATATLVALSVLVAGSSSANGALNGALASTSAARSDSGPSPLTAYWVDTLFRTPPTSTQAALGWRQYAQADTGTMNDGGPAPEPTVMSPGGAEVPVPRDAPRPASVAPVFMDGGSSTAAPATASATMTAPRPRSIAADKAEAGRIISVGMANGGHLSSEDHTQLAWLISQDTPLSLGAAQNRVTDVEARMHSDEVKAAEIARKTAAYASLWTALALLFGALVAAAAAISARWEDDKEAGFLPGTRVETVRL